MTGQRAEGHTGRRRMQGPGGARQLWPMFIPATAGVVQAAVWLLVVTVMSSAAPCAARRQPSSSASSAGRLSALVPALPMAALS